MDIKQQSQIQSLHGGEIQCLTIQNEQRYEIDADNQTKAIDPDFKASSENSNEERLSRNQSLHIESEDNESTVKCAACQKLKKEIADATLKLQTDNQEITLIKEDYQKRHEQLQREFEQKQSTQRQVFSKREEIIKQQEVTIRQKELNIQRQKQSIAEQLKQLSLEKQQFKNHQQQLEKMRLNLQDQRNKLQLENDVLNEQQRQLEDQQKLLKEKQDKYKQAFKDSVRFIVSSLSQLSEQSQRQGANVDREVSVKDVPFEDELKSFDTDLEAIAISIKRKYMTFQQEIDEYSQKLKGFASKLDEINRENTNNRTQMAAKYEIVAQRQIELQNTNNQLQDQIKKLTAQKEDKDIELNIKQDQMNKLKQQMQAKQSLLSDANLKFINLKQSIDQLESKIRFIEKNRKEQLDQQQRQHNDQQFRQVQKHQAKEQKYKQQVFTLKEQVTRANEQKDKINAQCQYLHQTWQQKQAMYEKKQKEFESSAVQALNRMLNLKQQARSGMNSSMHQSFNDVILLLKQETQKSEKYIDYILQLEHQNDELNLTLTTTNLQLTSKSQQVLDYQHQITQLNHQIQKLNQIIPQMSARYQKQINSLKTIVQSKITTAIEQTTSVYQGIIQSKDQAFKCKIETLQIQHGLSQMLAKKRIEDIQSLELRSNQQVAGLQQFIKKLTQDNQRAAQLKDLNIAQANDELKFLQSKLQEIESSKQSQQQWIDNLSAEVELVRKTILFVYDQLENNSLRTAIEALEEVEDEYHKGVIDLLNLIYHCHSQQRQQAAYLEHQIMMLKRQRQELKQSMSKLANLEQNVSKQQQKIKQSEKQSIKLKQQLSQLQNQKTYLAQKYQEVNELYNKCKTDLAEKTQQIEFIESLESQSNKNNEKLKAQLVEAKQKIQLLQNQFSDISRKYEESWKNINAISNEDKTKMDMIVSLKKQIEQLGTKENSYLKQIQQLKLKGKNQEKINSDAAFFKSQIAKLAQESEQYKQKVENLTNQKSNIHKEVQNLKMTLQKIEEANKQLTNKLKAREEQSINHRQNQFLARDNEKNAANDQTIKQLEVRNQKLSADMNIISKQKRQLEAKIIQLKKELEVQKLSPQSEPKKKTSWNEDDEGLIKGYEQMIQSIREEKSLLEEEIQTLKAKIKRLQMTSRIPISYISPPKSTIMEDKSPAKEYTSLSKQIKQQKKQISQKKSTIFGVNCLLDDQQAGRAFVLKTIDDIYGNKRLVESKLVYKYTEASRAFLFASLLPKIDLQNQCFVFLFSTKTNIFGVINYKKDVVSKQSALMFSVNNLKLVPKRSTADSSSVLAVAVQFNGDLNIGNSHLRMKPSNRTLAVKEVLGKYFEQYDKKQMFGKDYWRDDMAIQLTEFEIHRVYFK